ncbi:MAG TPA: SDR family NAD(P)-dependent oxidoreductase [Eoetvoesiella sp.]
MSSEKKVAVITGAASGIGLQIAHRLCQQDLRVVMLDRSEVVADRAADVKKNGGSADFITVDLGSTEQTLSAAEQVKERYGRCDILINNAGIHPKRNGAVQALDDISLDEWEIVFRVNLTAPFLLCQQFVPLMKEKKWGRVVNIASRAGRTYSERASTSYSASKAGLIGMTRKIAGDYGAFGITANCIAPGQIETPLARTSSPEVLENAAGLIRMRRLGAADEVASAAEYLVSVPAGFITGSVVDVNGGEFMP